jgi:DnaJ-class molecular chaperone
MKKTKGYTLIKKPDIMPCWTCNAEGIAPSNSKGTYTICPTCKGTGVWVEKHYIIVDEVNKIAIDSDGGG